MTDATGLAERIRAGELHRGYNAASRCGPPPSTRTSPRPPGSVPGMRDLLGQTADLAADFLESLPERPVFPRTTLEELRGRLAGPLPEGPSDPREVVVELAAAGGGGAVAMPGGRYFGFVIGGALPAALAADWLASAWDQNAGLYVCGPAASVVEEVAGAWLAELLGLPRVSPSASSPARRWRNLTALAAARHRVLARAGWDVERDGLTGRAAGPRGRRRRSGTSRSTVRCACSVSARGSIVEIAADGQGRMRAGRAAPTRSGGRPGDRLRARRAT